jgi:hypothetical protein
MPAVGRDAIVSRLQQWEEWTFTAGAVGVARSGELGYAYGTYSAGLQRGAYLRIWSRDAAGRWWLIVDAAS